MIVTTGFFDGVHLGHRHVIERLVALARGRDDESVVVTFWPHPRTVLQDGARELRLLTSLDEKQALLEGLGVDRVEVLPFNRRFAALTAEAYLRDVLRDRFGATTVLVGYDNRLGSDRLTASALRPLAASLGLDLVAVSPLSVLPGSDAPVIPDSALSFRPEAGGGRSGEISSTRIRTALSEGDVTGAASMLGYPYGLYGVVVAGNRLGRTIGFPTANMQLYEPLKLVPGNGVYAVEAEVLDRSWRGMCNIGVRPTVGGSARTIETHILDFDEDIYGLPIRIRFLRKIRDEIRFPSLDALRDQLTADRLAVLA